MKKIISIILLIVFISSCWEKVIEDTTKTKKKDFFVQTQQGNSFVGDTILRKTGQISSSQDISLSANASGRVSALFVKPGDSVRVWQVIATLDDNIGSYGINLERARIFLERQKINYESTEISLDKNIFDSQLTLSKLERNLQAFKKDSEQNILQSKDNLDNSTYNNLDSKSALELEKLDNNIEKLRLDYDIKIVTDSEQIESYKASLRKDFNNLEIALDDVIEFSDEILWITDLNRSENDNYEMFLGARDAGQKTISENNLRDLVRYKENDDFSKTDMDLQSGNISQMRMLEIIKYINEGYEKIQDNLSSLEQTLYNSIPSGIGFSQWVIDGFVLSINGYQSSIQWTYGGFITFWSWVKSFLRTYKGTQDSLLKSIELQEKDREIQFKNLSSWEVSATTSYERTILSIDDSIKDLDDQVKTAQSNLRNAKATRDITLRSLQNSIDDARISYTASAKEYAKLTITSPINGTISDVFTDAWQEVSSGTRLFGIVSNKTPEVEISFSSREKDLVGVGQEVFVDVWFQKIPGTIYSISDVADTNLNYKSTIVFDGWVSIIGNIVTILIPISTEKMLIPINIIDTQGEEIGMVTTLSGSIFENVRVRMGEVFGEYVEIVSCAQNCDDLKIITSDVTNYDENKFVIVEK